MYIYIYIYIHSHKHIYAYVLVTCIRLSVARWTVAYQAPLSMEFPRQEYWGGLPFPSPGDLPDPGIKPESPESPALTCGFFTASATELMFGRRQYA